MIQFPGKIRTTRSQRHRACDHSAGGGGQQESAADYHAAPANEEVLLMPALLLPKGLQLRR